MEYSHEKQKKKRKKTQKIKNHEIRQCRNYSSDVKARDILRGNIENDRFAKYAGRMNDESQRIKYLNFFSSYI